MARKPNYDYEKRKKEADRKAKKDAKREERQRRRLLGLPDEDETMDGEGGEGGEGADGEAADTPAEADANRPEGT